LRRSISGRCFMSPKITVHTLGCKVNQYDSEAILREFSDAGFTVSGNEPDVFIINTCTVTNVSDKKSRQLIKRVRRENPNALIVAYGCYAQVEPDALENIAMVIGTSERTRLVELITAKLGFETKGTGKEAPAPKRTRAYLKIQDGCDRFCAYCIVPYARGGVVSRAAVDVLAEAEALVRAGSKEIVLSGIQIAAYGNNLIELMKRVHGLPGLERLRLGSLEPNIIDDAFLECIRDLPKLCDHFHLSLQSGCDRTLERMNRRYTTAKYAAAAAGLRGVFPKMGLTTDMIAGFPGESEDDFDESCAFAEEMRFSRIHVFTYSAKKGTAAAGFPGQIDKETKERRSRRLREAADRLGREFYKQFMNMSLPVLFEAEVEPNLWEGHTSGYMTVRAPSASNLQNRIVNVRLLRGENGIVYGEECR